MGFVKEFDQLPLETQQAVVDRVRSLLPERAKILILSHTGSRAFGWGAECYDIDVRGVVYCKDHWDTFHDGWKWDVNLEIFSHFLQGLRYHYWTIFEDLANPFYLHEGWDQEEYMKLCTAANVANHLYSIRTQIAQVTLGESVRTALHAYRLLLSPIHFLRTGVVEINIRKLASLYNPKFAVQFADAYASRKGVEVDWTEVMADLHHFEDIMLQDLKGRGEEIDKERMDRWREKIEQSI